MLDGVLDQIGCIPKKALVRAMQVLKTVRQAGEFGIAAKEVSFDWRAVMACKQKIVEALQGDKKRSLEERGIEYFHQGVHDQNGYLITNGRMETSVEGIYAAGDVQVQLFRQVSTAVGDGTVAALAAEQYITRKKAGVFDIRDWWYKPAVDKQEARPKA